MRALTRDNNVSVEFDPWGFSIKDLRTRMALLRCDSSRELYPLRQAPVTSPPSASALLASHASTLWHARLGHPGHDALQQLSRSIGFHCSKSSPHTCDACRRGKHVRLPFSVSNNVSSFPFQLLHCDVWTSPIMSNSGFKYYLVIMDDYSHYVWTFPLRHKSDVLPTLISFHAFVRTQFETSIMCLQTDNGKEFDNSASRAFFATHGIVLRLTCPYTSQQNSRAERVLRTLNDGVRTLLFHASIPPTFWPDALAASTYLLNRRPCRPRNNCTPFHLLFGVPPEYSHLRVFGCLCYPNLASTAPHKLAPRSTKCIFLGYPLDQKGYKCYNPMTKRVIISRHVTFDETCFPFMQVDAATPPMDSACSSCPPDDVLIQSGPHQPRRRAPAAARHVATPAPPSVGTHPLLPLLRQPASASSTALLRQVVDHLRQAFAIKDLGALHFFLGIQVRRDAAGFHLNQAQYAEDILERAGMANCKPATTPVEVQPKLSATDGEVVTDATFYRSITRALQYLTLSHPDIAYGVNQACLHMHAPRDVHWNLVKRILRYIRGTINHGITISTTPSTTLTVYSDADWAGCPDTRR